MRKGSFALQLFLYASLVSLIWLGGYAVLSGLFAVPMPEKEQTPPHITSAVDLPSPVSTQWSVLAVMNEEKRVTDFLFRYADFIADTLVFVQVPTDTKVELSAGGYEVLKVHSPEAPALFMVSDMFHLFSEETWCMTAEEVGVALLGIRPAECYIIEKELFDSMTEPDGGQVYFQLNCSVREMIVTVAEHAVTNDTMKEEMVYLESYLDIDHIYYRKLPGKKTAEEYCPDKEAARAMVESFRAGFFEEDNPD